MSVLCLYLDSSADLFLFLIFIVILNSLVSGMVAQLLDWKFVDYSQLSRLADSFASAFSAQGLISIFSSFFFSIFHCTQ